MSSDLAALACMSLVFATAHLLETVLESRCFGCPVCWRAMRRARG